MKKFILILSSLVLIISLSYAGYVIIDENRESEVPSINVSGSGVTEEGFTLKASLNKDDNSICLDALQSDNEGRFVYDGKNGEDLQFTIDLEVSGYKAIFDEVKIAIDDSKDGILDKGYVKLPSNEISVKMSEFTKTTDGDTNIYKKSVVVKFTWGDMFNNLNPSVYYDTEDGLKVSDEDALAALNTMKDVASKTTLNVKANVR